MRRRELNEKGFEMSGRLRSGPEENGKREGSGRYYADGVVEQRENLRRAGLN